MCVRCVCTEHVWRVCVLVHPQPFCSLVLLFSHRSRFAPRAACAARSHGQCFFSAPGCCTCQFSGVSFAPFVFGLLLLRVHSFGGVTVSFSPSLWSPFWLVVSPSVSHLSFAVYHRSRRVCFGACSSFPFTLHPLRGVSFGLAFVSSLRHCLLSSPLRRACSGGCILVSFCFCGL